MYLLLSLPIPLGGPPETDSEANLWTRFRGSGGLGTDLNTLAPTNWKESDFLWKLKVK